MSDKLSAVKLRNLIVVSGYYGFDNLGDEAILEELVSELKQLVRPDDIVVLSNNPDKTARLYGVKAVDRWRISDLLNVLSKARLFISGGGGLFQDTTGARTVVFYGGQILLARLSGAPVLIYAQGLGPLNGPASKTLTRLAWRLADHVTVRDQASLAMAKSWGINPELTADPVWSLKPTPLPESFKTPQLDKSSSPLIGISLRPSGLLKASHFPLLAGIFKQTFPPDTTLLMLPLQRSQDSQVLGQLLDECGKLNLKASMVNADEIERPSQWLTLIEGCDMLIGMRLHALLMALKVGKPVVGLPYDPKVTYLCKTFQQPMLDFAKQPEDGSAWLDTIHRAWPNRVELADQAKRNTAAVMQVSCKNFDILARILKS